MPPIIRQAGPFSHDDRFKRRNIEEKKPGTHGVGFTDSEVIGYVKRKLGDGIVDVELTDNHMQDVLHDTKRCTLSVLVSRRSVK